MMAGSKELLSKIQKVVRAVEKGEMDPLDIGLSEAYHDLRALAADVKPKLDIDEMLNDLLGVKISRVQELARILSAPEIYVSRLKELKPRQVSKLIAYKQPLKMTRLSHSSLTESLSRVMQHLDALSRVATEEKIPELSGLPDDFKFVSEDSVFLEDLRRYLKKIPRKKRIPIADIIDAKDFDLFLRHFLYIVVLISRGDVEYFRDENEILRR